MSEIFICKTETKYIPRPCFNKKDNELSCPIQVTECGVDLSGIPENDQTKDYFRIARLTGLGLILSFEDIKQAGACGYLHEAPSESQLGSQMRSIDRCAERFLRNAKAMIERTIVKQAIEPSVGGKR